MVIGDAQPFCAAVLVARSPAVDAAQLAVDIAAMNETLPDYAKVRRFIVATEPFSLANGALTDNGRLRREVIAARYAAAIAALYSPTFQTTESGALHAIF